VIAVLVAVYRAFPWRPRCGTGHTWLCQAMFPVSAKCYHEHHDR
jgi:hypothetical protein